MIFIAILSAIALGIAAFSLLRLSRAPIALPQDSEERTFATLRPGDVVMLLEGDWLVVERTELAGAPPKAELIVLRSGRLRRYFFVPPEGPLALFEERPASFAELAAASGRSTIDRAAVELLPACLLEGACRSSERRTRLTESRK